MMTYIGPQMFPHGLKPISKEEADLLVDLGLDVRGWNVWRAGAGMTPPEALPWDGWPYSAADNRAWDSDMIERLYFIKVEDTDGQATLGQ